MLVNELPLAARDPRPVTCSFRMTWWSPPREPPPRCSTGRDTWTEPLSRFAQLNARTARGRDTATSSLYTTAMLRMRGSHFHRLRPKSQERS
jgi:hypothetical protein